MLYINIEQTLEVGLYTGNTAVEIFFSI